MFCFFFSIVSFSQYSDLKEYGYNGKVRKITLYEYDSLNPEVTSGAIVHKENWHFKEVREYDENGVFQKGQKSVRSEENSNNIFFTTSVAKYSKGNKTVIEYESTGAVFDSLKFTWTSDSSYHLIYYDDKGKIRGIYDNLLTSWYRDKGGHSFILFPNDIKIQEFRYINTFDKNKRVISSKRTDILNNTSKITLPQELSFDSHGNPSEIRLTFAGTNHPYKISIRYFEYY